MTGRGRVRGKKQASRRKGPPLPAADPLPPTDPDANGTSKSIRFSCKGEEASNSIRFFSQKASQGLQNNGPGRGR